MRKSAKLLLCLVALLAALMMAMPAMAADEAKINEVMEDVGDYLYNTVKSPQVGSIGGEWAVLGLARSQHDVPQSYYDNYYNTVVDYVKECDGVLHTKKYTEYSRVIVALSSIGRDARDVGGYDLTRALGDYEKTIWQGINGPIWALIALDSRNYPIPQNSEAKTQATRQMYVDLILASQLADGGWSLMSVGEPREGDSADPDITGMALQALAKYQDQAKVKTAVDKAVDCLAKMQNNQGGFSSWGTANSESCAQVIVALTSLGIDPDDSRFVKGGKGLVDNLLTFYKKGEGFLHVMEGSGSNLMATEQAYYALTAAWRSMKDMNTLYDMTDVKANDSKPAQENIVGLEGKHADVKKTNVVNVGITFGDISGANAHANQPAIEALAARGIITGDTAADGKTAFRPNDTMTRAEFAAIVVRALGLEPAAKNVFSDIKPGAWYAAYIDTANAYGIVKGTTATTFEPESKITRQDAAVMVARAAALCGMDNVYDTMASRDVLAQFTDYITVADYAMSSMAFCYGQDILDDSAMQIEPVKAILRCEIAQMLYNLLAQAKLL